MLFKYLMGAALALGVMAPASAVTLVNLNGRVNASINGTNAVTIQLAAGDYKLRFVKDQFTAHNRFNNVSGCDANGMNCTKGWEMQALYYFGANDFDRTNDPRLGQIGAGFYFQTAQAAFDSASGLVQRFTIPAGGNSVSFYINDDKLTDNQGGISLSIAAVPEPASWALLIAGFGMIGFAARRRRTMVVTS